MRAILDMTRLQLPSRLSVPPASVLPPSAGCKCVPTRNFERNGSNYKHRHLLLTTSSFTKLPQRRSFLPSAPHSFRFFVYAPLRVKRDASPQALFVRPSLYSFAVKNVKIVRRWLSFRITFPSFLLEPRICTSSSTFDLTSP